MRILGIVLLANLSFGQGLATRIERILHSSPAARQSNWGIQVVDLQTRKVVYARNADRFFIPASNTKLFTTALALTRLGPGHKFRTRITAPAPIDAQGRVSELRLVGGGDPNLSGRIVPYVYDSKPENALRYIEKFARQLADSGLKTVEGDVIGDDSAYANDPYPEGWAMDDPVYDYGAPVSALVVNDGTFKIRVFPDGRVETNPAIPDLIIHNRAIAASVTKLQYDRLPGTSELTITGTIADAEEGILGVEDQALFAAEALRDALQRNGIRVGGAARAEHFARPGVSLLEHESLPLIEDLRVINKESMNLHAEMTLLEVARTMHGTGSREDGLAEMKAFLKEIGISDGQYLFKDGSGLSRQTLVTPEAITTLLLFMYGTPNRADWLSTFPIGGEDGTLAKRFQGSAIANQILAKTGSIMHVNALSGYAGERYAFSILVNNSNLPSAPVRRVMDQVALALVSGSGTRHVPVSKRTQAVGRP